MLVLLKVINKVHKPVNDMFNLCTQFVFKILRSLAEFGTWSTNPLTYENNTDSKPANKPIMFTNKRVLVTLSLSLSG